MNSSSSPAFSSAVDFDNLPVSVQHYISLVADQFQRIPGSAIFLRYVKSSYQNDPVRSILELFLVLFAIRYLLAPKYSTKPNYVKLSEEEIDELVDEWQPEPLTAKMDQVEATELEKRTVIVGPTGPKCKLLNGKMVTNLASQNYYNLASNDHLKERAIATLRTYGVGPCGPPGFYGTQDVHMKIESDLAAFLGMQASIIYAQSFSTASSVIPAFSKRGDVIVADKACNYSVRKGIQISRSQVRWFEHNDMSDLERVLKSVAKEQEKKGILTRRFIITEGLFEATGEMCDLVKIVELKLKYKFRLILDETNSFGALGRTGRGITEHSHVDAAEVDMLIGSMSGPLLANGGFCAGSDEVVEHQRLTALAYTYSAALPAMSAVTASETLLMLQTQPDMITSLRENIKIMWSQLDPRSDWVYCSSAPENPIMVMVLKPEVVQARRLSHQDELMCLQEIVDECLAQGVLITKVKVLSPSPSGSKSEIYIAPPAIKICMTNGLPKKEVEKAGTTIRHAITKIMSRKK